MHLRTQDDAEIDIVIQKGPGNFHFIEFKSGELVDNSDLRAMVGFKKDFPEATFECWCRAERAFEIDGIRCVPWQEGLAKLLEAELAA